MDSLIIFCAKYLLVAVLLGWALIALRISPAARKQFIVATVFSGIIALVVSRIAGHVYFDPRPFVTQHVQPLIAHGTDNGFPSDHALLTMTLTAIAYFFSKKIAAGMLVVTVLVSGARVLAKVHSPLDIGGAWLIGILSVLAGFYLTRYVFSKYHAARD